MKLQIALIALVFRLALGQAYAGDGHGEHEGHGHSEAGHSEHEEAEAQNTGPGYAVTKADRHLGLQLSEQALKTIGLKIISFNPRPEFTIPHKSLVHEREKTGIYRLRDGWLKFIPISESAASDHHSPQFIQSAQLQPGDQIVIEGAEFLRIAELDVFSGEGAGHHH